MANSQANSSAGPELPGANHVHIYAMVPSHKVEGICLGELVVNISILINGD